jgi:hypothetical protein
MTTTTLWRYDDPVWAETDLSGYTVEALDGTIGKVDEASKEIGARYLVVDTGPWIFGKKVMVPAGIVDGVDTRKERVYVERTRDEIKNAPEFDVKRYHDPEYRQELGMYYERIGMTRSPDRV